MSSAFDELSEYIANEDSDLFKMASQKMKTHPLLTSKSVEMAFAYDPDEEVENFINTLKQSQRLRKAEFERVKAAIEQDADVGISLDDALIDAYDDELKPLGDEADEVLLGEGPKTTSASAMFQNIKKQFLSSGGGSALFEDLPGDGDVAGTMDEALSSVMRVRRLFSQAIITDEETTLDRKGGPTKQQLLNRIDESLELFRVSTSAFDEGEGLEDEVVAAPLSSLRNRGRRGLGVPEGRQGSKSGSPSPDGLRSADLRHRPMPAPTPASMPSRQLHEAPVGQTPIPTAAPTGASAPEAAAILRAPTPEETRRSMEEFFLDQAVSERMERRSIESADAPTRAASAQNRAGQGGVIIPAAAPLDVQYLLGQQREYHAADSATGEVGEDGAEQDWEPESGESESSVSYYNDSSPDRPAAEAERPNRAVSPTTPFSRLTAAGGDDGRHVRFDGQSTEEMGKKDGEEESTDARVLFVARGDGGEPMSGLRARDRGDVSTQSSLHALTADETMGFTPTQAAVDNPLRKSDPEVGWI